MNTLTEIDRNYLELCRGVPPRPIRDEDEYSRTKAEYDRWADKARKTGSLEQHEQDYFETLGLLIADYGDKCRRIDVRTVLAHLAQSHGMTFEKMGQVVGGTAMASKIMEGHRGISKTDLDALAKLAGCDSVTPTFLKSMSDSQRGWVEPMPDK
jgi:antitoxin component HigA of HigAB toxin-antitoxin module